MQNSDEIKVTGVVLVIVWQDCVLLQLRDDFRSLPFPLCWVLPGGGVEGGESGMEAAKRELMEEYGMPFPLREIPGVTPKGNAFYHVRIEANNLDWMEEGRGFAFVDVDILPTLMGHGTDKPGMIGGILSTRVREHFAEFRNLVLKGEDLPAEFFA